MRLHEELGPRATTISAIAEEAGVQRLTVYRHFPDETAVFQACTAHWLGLNPPPDPSGWAAIEDPLERLKAALTAFYRYYAANPADVVGVLSRRRRRAGAAAADETICRLRYGNRRRSRRSASTPASRQRAASPPPSSTPSPSRPGSDLDARGFSDAYKVALVMRWIAGVRET